MVIVDIDSNIFESIPGLKLRHRGAFNFGTARYGEQKARVKRSVVETSITALGIMLSQE